MAERGPAYRPSMAVKKPRIRFRVRGFWCLRLVLLRRALTRTSVGNEKYEYERNQRDAARANATADRYDPVFEGPAAGAVAVRHSSTLTDDFGHVNRFFGIWRRIGTFRIKRSFGRLDVRTPLRPIVANATISTGWRASQTARTRDQRRTRAAAEAGSCRHPGKAGIRRCRTLQKIWIPACAGMTSNSLFRLC